MLQPSKEDLEQWAQVRNILNMERGPIADRLAKIHEASAPRKKAKTSGKPKGRDRSEDGGETREE